MVEHSFIILLFLTSLWAEASVNVTVDNRQIDEGDSITLTVTANNFNSKPDVILPNIPNFRIISGPNQSSSTNVQFINGKMTKNATSILTWILIPSKTGQLEIPAISIKVDKKTYHSNPIIITVNKRGNIKGAGITKFFIEAEVDNKTPYRGEQVTLIYTLYTQIDVTSFNEELPKYKGFWTEEIFSPKKLSLRQVQKNKVQYHAATIKKLALFPTRSGTIQIDPMVAIIGIPENQRRNNFSLFSLPSKQFTVSTNTLHLDVKPLPINHNGEETAVVGNWNVQSSISSINVKQDEAITFQVIVNGNGNIQAVDITNIYFPNELEVFEPEIKVLDNILRDQIGGKKQFEWVLIPRFAGDIYLPSAEVTYFDPKMEIWVTKSTPKYHLDVVPNEKITAKTIGLSKEEVALMGKDIRFLDESRPKWRDRDQRLFSVTAMTLLLLSGMLFVFPNVLIFSQGRLDRTSGNRQARRALKSSLAILDNPGDTPKEIYTNIYNSVVLFINHKTGSSKVEYSNSELLNFLKIQNLDDICPKLEGILIHTETARFTPLSHQDAKKDLQIVKQLLEEANNGW